MNISLVLCVLKFSHCPYYYILRKLFTGSGWDGQRAARPSTPHRCDCAREEAPNSWTDRGEDTHRTEAAETTLENRSEGGRLVEGCDTPCMTYHSFFFSLSRMKSSLAYTARTGMQVLYKLTYYLQGNTRKISAERLDTLLTQTLW